MGRKKPPGSKKRGPTRVVPRRDGYWRPADRAELLEGVQESLEDPDLMAVGVSQRYQDEVGITGPVFILEGVPGVVIAFCYDRPGSNFRLMPFDEEGKDWANSLVTNPPLEQITVWMKRARMISEGPWGRN